MRECPKNKGLQAFARVKKSSEKASDNEVIRQIKNTIKTLSNRECLFLCKALIDKLSPQRYNKIKSISVEI